MSNIKNWSDLEEYAKGLTDEKSKRTPGSGNSKKEEDVVSSNLLIQTKFSESKNTTILDKDVKRLEEASTQLIKVPLFITKTKEHLICSLLVNDASKEVITSAIKVMTVINEIKKIEEHIKNKLTLTELHRVNKILNESVKSLESVVGSIRVAQEKLSNSIDSKIKNAHNVDLFEQE